LLRDAEGPLSFSMPRRSILKAGRARWPICLPCLSLSSHHTGWPDVVLSYSHATAGSGMLALVTGSRCPPRAARPHHNNVPRAGNRKARASARQKGVADRGRRQRNGVAGGMGCLLVVATSGRLLHGRGRVVEVEHFSVGGRARTEPRGTRAALGRSHIKCRRRKRRRARLEARKPMAGKSTARAAIASRHGARRGRTATELKRLMCAAGDAPRACVWISLLAGGGCLVLLLLLLLAATLLGCWVQRQAQC